MLSTPFSSSSKITRLKVKSFALTLSSCIPPFLDRSPFREKVAETWLADISVSNSFLGLLSMRTKSFIMRVVNGANLMAEK